MQKASPHKLTYWTGLGKSKMITKPVLGKHYIKPQVYVAKEVKVRQPIKKTTL